MYLIELQTPGICGEYATIKLSDIGQIEVHIVDCGNHLTLNIDELDNLIELLSSTEKFIQKETKQKSNLKIIERSKLIIKTSNHRELIAYSNSDSAFTIEHRIPGDTDRIQVLFRKVSNILEGLHTLKYKLEHEVDLLETVEGEDQILPIYLYLLSIFIKIKQTA